LLITYVLDKLSWMRAERIWPNGQRYTWTDAFGVVLLVSLYEELGKLRYLDEAEWWCPMSIGCSGARMGPASGKRRTAPAIFTVMQ
jgi:hypothetical protein